MSAQFEQSIYATTEPSLPVVQALVVTILANDLTPYVAQVQVLAARLQVRGLLAPDQALGQAQVLFLRLRFLECEDWELSRSP